jgi:hypothetical protein
MVSRDGSGYFGRDVSRSVLEVVCTSLAKILLEECKLIKAGSVHSPVILYK